jgi:outer membrane receptor protein involved in Fe transport
MRRCARHEARNAVTGRASICSKAALGLQLTISVLLLYLPGPAFPAAEADAQHYAGRRVSDVLRSLAAESITFIYNSQILGEEELVRAEPRSRSGVELAREILAPYGLVPQPVASGVYAIVRDALAARSTARPHVDDAPIEEVVVQTSRYSLATDYADAHTFLTQEQVQALPRLADETLRAVQRLPGTAGNGVSSLASIRGGEPTETAILLDGLRLYEPFHLKHFFSPVSLLDSRLIERMDVFSGGYPAMYGERMSAVIDARTVRPATPRYYELGLSLFHANAMAHTSFDKERGHALLSIRRSNLSELAQFSQRELGEPEYFDGFARVDYAITSADTLAVSALASRDRIKAVRESKGQRAFAEYRNNYVWATWDREWSEGASTRLTGSFIDVTNERRGTVDDPGRRVGRVADERFFHIAGLRLDGELSGDRLAHRYGVEVRRLDAAYDYASEVFFAAGAPFPDSPPRSQTSVVSPDPHGYETAAFWDTRINVGERWTTQLGLRFDTQSYDASAAAEQWSPRLSLRYELGPHTLLRASAGRYYQAQGINELQVEDGLDRFHAPQFADHAIVGFEHAFASGLGLRVEAYRKKYGRPAPRFENLFNVLGLLPELEFDRVRIEPDSARAEGAELLLSWRPHSSWSGWLGYTWSQARDRIEGTDVPRSWDQKHAVSAGLAWVSAPWSVTVADSWHTGWPTTSLTLVNGDAGPRVVIGQRNTQRLGDYHSLDLRIQRTFQLSRGELDVFFEASNLTSRENPCCTEYDLRFDNGISRLESDEKHWLPLVPSIGVLWRFDPLRRGSSGE